MTNDGMPTSPKAATVVVSSVARNGYNADEPYRDDEAERTHLLGAGAADSDDGLARERMGSWAGWEDFDNIPPWRRPSVSVTRDP